MGHTGLLPAGVKEPALEMATCAQAGQHCDGLRRCCGSSYICEFRSIFDSTCVPFAAAGAELEPANIKEPALELATCAQVGEHCDGLRQCCGSENVCEFRSIYDSTCVPFAAAGVELEPVNSKEPALELATCAQVGEHCDGLRQCCGSENVCEFRSIYD